MNKEFYKAAVGERSSDYYMKEFERFERNPNSVFSWNWSALLFGPLWMGHRKIGYRYIFLFTGLVTFFSLFFVDVLGFWGGVLSFFIYTLVFPVLGNKIYFSVICSYLLDSVSTDKELLLELRKRFRTGLD